jgi:chromosome segregation ATPase
MTTRQVRPTQANPRWEEAERQIEKLETKRAQTLDTLLKTETKLKPLYRSRARYQKQAAEQAAAAKAKREAVKAAKQAVSKADDPLMNKNHPVAQMLNEVL